MAEKAMATEHPLERHPTIGSATRIGVDAAVGFMLGGTYLLSAFAKTTAYDPMVAVIRTSRLVPLGFESAVATIVLAVEVVIGVVLWASVPRPRLGPIGLWGSAGIAATFAAFAVWRQVAGVTLPCSCFGTLFQLPTGVSGLLAAGLFVISVDRLSHSAIADGPRPRTTEVESSC